ncbi:hypothetical protein AZSI13_03190 [Azospira sp. I13]|uniref:hypothetical protein n=1 Tax=Azospira sp. I13 TaxID=1765050 RepID=UPI000D3F7D2C|nr:hypothetical protein [Azospira sp. I13]GBG00992.1 hypothetical protein AZSI13_03190 [Azospira sp. I13]
MSDTPPTSADSSTSPIGVSAIIEWLALPASEDLQQELNTLKGHLLALEDLAASGQQRHKALDLIHERTLLAVNELVPRLSEAGLPLPRKVRALLKAAQDLLEHLARDFLTSVEDQVEEHMVKGLRQPPEIALWRAQHLLQRHLFISALVAAPAAVGIWEMTHRTFGMARQRGVEEFRPQPEPCNSIVLEYAAALLLACAQPASFAARELQFIADIAARHGRRLEFLSATDERHHGLFWIDPTRDTPAIALARRLPPPETPVLWFSCDGLAYFLERRLQSLDSAKGTPETLDLPEFAGTLAGRSVLRRIVRFWGNPARRRFPRRRQSYRVNLHAGLEPLTQLLRGHLLEEDDGSSWMITNESPDGYALMHLSGAADRLEVGDIVALKPESHPPGRKHWQTCIVRWALSENPEHLEIGLQILAPQALPATLALPGENASAHPHVAILPAIPGLRPHDSLVIPAGLLAGHEGHLVLLVERDNLEIREVRTTALEEQTGRVEIFATEPENNPG